MKRSFYHYLMTLRGPNPSDEEQVFANQASKDIQFPKQSDNYEEISDYLEMNVDYLSNMDIFDRIWRKYLENNR
ncbi:MAG: YozE family protein [Tetragenococcus sp.]|nr:YozE family protein [Tetragenococcus sp.]